MRLIPILMTLGLCACSNATFKGVKGNTPRDNSPPVSEDGTGTTPSPNPVPPIPVDTKTPPTETPTTQNPSTDPGSTPCTPLAVLLGSPCQQPPSGGGTMDPPSNTDGKDSGGKPDPNGDYDDDDSGKDDPMQNNPGQN